MSPGKEYCGTNPTGIQNDSPSHGHPSSHSLWKCHKFRHRRLPKCPLLPKYGCGNPASARLSPENMPPPKLQDRFPQYTRFSHPRLQAFSAWQRLHNYHCYSRFLCCFSDFFQFPYCEMTAAFPPLPLFSPSYSLPYCVF